MTGYDYWLLSAPGGPEDPAQYQPTAEEERDLEIENFRRTFYRMDQRSRAKLRRSLKRSTYRRRQNPEWYARQRRLDRNAQVIF